MLKSALDSKRSVVRGKGIVGDSISRGNLARPQRCRIDAGWSHVRRARPGHPLSEADAIGPQCGLHGQRHTLDSCCAAVELFPFVHSAPVRERRCWGTRRAMGFELLRSCGGILGNEPSAPACRCRGWRARGCAMAGNARNRLSRHSSNSAYGGVDNPRLGRVASREG